METTRRLPRLNAMKSILWFLVGGAAAVGLFRFWKGLGATTALTDLTPWGFWIGFDVMGGVALAAGGFVLTATVYVFHMEKFRPIVRPAVLTAFLGYIAVIVGLLFDLGLPWNIWHMIFFWNPSSPLFEVGWCVMLYTTVLGLEFLPVVLEQTRHPLLMRVLGVIKKVTLGLVILGIMFSTLHQSSLGSLFLIMPHRLHELWYTPILPILFFVSAVGLGLSMIITESLVSSWLYEKEYEIDLLGGLGKAAAGVLWFYVALRLADVAVRGALPSAFQGDFNGTLFLVELFVSGIIPATMFSMPSVRSRVRRLRVAAGFGVVGFVMNRIDVGGLAMIETTGTRYVPSWMELAASFGVVAMAALIFFWVAERFALMPGGPMKKARQAPQPFWFGLPRQFYTFAGGAALAVAMMPGWVFDGYPVVAQPVHPPAYGPTMVIDGDRNNKAVIFDHEMHAEDIVGEDQGGCAGCHHMVRIGEQASDCADCHRDEELPTDIFNHEEHVRMLDKGPGCVACHTDPKAPKTRAHTKPCLDCHQGMIPAHSPIRPANAPDIGLAPSYTDAMHGLCKGCHDRLDEEMGEEEPVLGACKACHTGEIPPFNPLDPDRRLH